MIPGKRDWSTVSKLLYHSETPLTPRDWPALGEHLLIEVIVQCRGGQHAEAVPKVPPPWSASYTEPEREPEEKEIISEMTLDQALSLLRLGIKNEEGLRKRVFELESVLHAVRADRPTAHSQDVWDRINEVLGHYGD